MKKKSYDSGEDLIRIGEAARRLDLTRHAIMMQIQNGSIPSRRIGFLWHVKWTDVMEWRKDLYSRLRKKDSKGTLVFDLKEGRYNTKSAAAYLHVPTQKIYYLIRSGQLPAKRHGGEYILLKEDLDKYQ